MVMMEVLEIEGKNKKPSTSTRGPAVNSTSNHHARMDARVRFIVHHGGLVVM